MTAVQFNQTQSIPKIIHHVWLGADAPSAFLRECRASFKRLHPDWEFSLTAEDRFFDSATPEEVSDIYETISDLWTNPALEPFQAYNLPCFFNRCLHDYRGKHDRRSIASDFVRVCLLYCWGGFYVDWDIYALQPLDRFLNDHLVFAKIRDSLVGEAVIGCRPEDERIGRLLHRYLATQSPESGVCCLNLSGFADENNLFAYPSEYFVPHQRKEAASEEAKYRFTANTHGIHCWKEGAYDLSKLEAISRQLYTPPTVQQKSEPKKDKGCNCYRSVGQ